MSNTFNEFARQIRIEAHENLGSYNYITNAPAERLLQNPDVAEILTRSTHNGVKTAREKFFNHMARVLEDETWQAGVAMREAIRKQALETNNFSPATSTVNLIDLIGADGVKLYQAALEEERYDSNFIKALFKRSLTSYKNTQNNTKNRNPVGFVLGISGSGKSVLQRNMVKKLTNDGEIYTDPATQTSDEFQHSILTIDGGIVRETSQIYTSIIKLAMYLGYSSIEDLHTGGLRTNNSGILDQKIFRSLKDTLEEAANATENCGIVFVETMSTWLFGAGFNKLRDYHKKKREIECSMIVENEDEHDCDLSASHDTVAVMGRRRANNCDPNPYRENFELSAGIKAESKRYSNSGMHAGRVGSKLVAREFERITRKKPTIQRYALILVKEENNTWIPAKPGDINTRPVSRAQFKAWRASDKTTDLFSYQIPQPFTVTMTESERVRLQQLYMSALYKKARQLAQNLENPVIDPQGRVLIKLNLSQTELKDLIVPFTTNPEHMNRPLDYLSAATCLKLSEDTTVSLDYAAALPQILTKYGVDDNIIQQYLALPRGSVIALQQEIDFHISGMLRTIEKVFSKINAEGAPIYFSQEELDSVHDKVARALNEKIMERFANLLRIHSLGETINIGAINKVLDAERKIMAKEVYHQITAEIFDLPQFDNVPLNPYVARLKKHGKHLASVITATNNNILHTANGMATFIEHSELTAHDRKPRPESAIRQIITCKIDEDGSMKQKHSPIRCRVPSLALKEKSRKEKRAWKKPLKIIKKLLSLDTHDVYERIFDVADKLDYIRDSYKFNERLIAPGDKLPRAFIYNLHTSISQDNMQRESLKDIIRGSHLYNARELARNQENVTFCLIQNIAVNYYTEELRKAETRSDEAYVAVRDEASLMADLSLLHTLYDHVNEEFKTDINAIFDHYKAFLAESSLHETDENKYTWFAASPHGVQAALRITALKNSMARPAIEDTSQDIVAHANQALLVIMTNNLHYKPEYAKLVQALSIFIEKGSISGCKSANERAQAVNGRVAILDALLHDPESLGEFASILKEALTNYPRHTHATNELISASSADAYVNNLKLALNRTFKATGTQLGASLISLDDQMGPAKLGPRRELKDKSAFSLFKRHFMKIDTNHSEDEELNGTLYAEHASSMQSHKKAGNYLAQAAENAAFAKNWRKDERDEDFRDSLQP